MTPWCSDVPQPPPERTVYDYKGEMRTLDEDIHTMGRSVSIRVATRQRGALKRTMVPPWRVHVRRHEA